MTILSDRIDEVRAARPGLAGELRCIASEMPGSATQRSLTQLAEALDQNRNSAEIAGRFPEYAWLLTIQSGAATTDAMIAMLEQSTHQYRLRVKKIRAIAYPTVLIFVALVLLLAASAFLIPPFDEMYDEFALRLPWSTSVVISVSRFVVAAPIVAALLVVGFCSVVVSILWLWIGDGPIKRAITGRASTSRTLRGPMAKACLQLAELCDDGVELTRSLKIVSGCDHNQVLRSALAQLSADLADGLSNPSCSRAAAVLPPNVLFALHCGQRRVNVENGLPASAVNSELLRELSANYRDAIVGRKEWAPFLVGQASVIVVGIVIAFTVISLFAPMVSLVTALSS